ncbi:MAG TPA: polysaccharide deacetylase family protein [Candidatus Krumholzibacteria bacterium]|nr:polysaccharide deacetylase family protein [Candidatus Krumholzibacteria bacterium]
MAHGIPVLMYHSIGRVLPDWHWALLTLVASTFESHLIALSKGGYTTVGLPELFDYVSGRCTLPKRTLVLTFDDGYLDNWTHAVPLLRKYGLRDGARDTRVRRSARHPAAHAGGRVGRTRTRGGS